MVKNVVILCTIVIVLIICFDESNYAYAIKTINDNATGGDCSSIGTWNAQYKTCKLSSDLSEGIVIASNGITLDGNGHTITGVPNKDIISFNQNGVNIGVFLNSVSGVTVQNMNVKNFGYGITLQNSNSDTVTNNISSGNIRDGIFLLGSSSNTITSNTLYGNTTPNISLGIDLSATSTNNKISGNNAYSNNAGIEVDGSGNTVTTNIVTSNTILGIYFNNGASNNVLNDNTISYNGIGINLDQSTQNNKVYNNNFVDNQKDAESNAYSFVGLATFTLSMPIGGNYWSDFNNTSKGCNDPDSDNICDSKSVATLQNTIPDSLAWNYQNGWHTVFTTTGNIVVEAQSPSGNAITYTASANKDGNPLSVTCNPQSGSKFPLGSTMVVCTATNGRTTSFTVKVQDTTPPTVTPPANQVVNEMTPTGAVVNYPQPTATDNVDVVSGPTCTPTSGSTFPMGVTTITCKASDAAGNVGIAKFTVTVKDTIPPTISAQNISTQVSSTSGGPVNYQLPPTTDNVGVISESCNPPSGSIFPIGNTTVTCTAADAAGNVGTASFVISVKYVPPPLQPPTTPTNLVATAQSSSSIHLSWSASPNATSYDVLRANSESGPYGQLATGISTTIFDDNGVSPSTTYYYQIVAINSAGTSTPSGTISATTQTSVQPLTTTNSTTQIQPTQNQTPSPTQATNNVVNVNSFQVQYSGTGVTILGIEPNPTYDDLTISIQVSSPTPSLELIIPRALFDSKQGSSDIPFIAEVDGALANSQDTNPTSTTRTIFVDIGPNSKQIEIIGTYLASSQNNLQTTVPPYNAQNNAQVIISSGASNTNGTCSANDCFNPQVVSINVGGTVTWTNDDNVGHTVTSGHPSDPQTGTVFDSSLIASGKSYSFTFQNAGIYYYFCQVHPWMAGEVAVGQSPQPLYSSQPSSQPPVLDLPPISQPTAEINQTAILPQIANFSLFSTYKNSEYGFSVEYPKAWTVEENYASTLHGNLGLVDFSYDSQNYTLDVSVWGKITNVSLSGNQYLNQMSDNLKQNCISKTFSKDGVTCDYTPLGATISNTTGKEIFLVIYREQITASPNSSYQNEVDTCLQAHIPHSSDVWELNSCNDENVGDNPNFSNLILKIWSAIASHAIATFTIPETTTIQSQVVFNASPQDIESINEAKNNQTIAAEVNVGNNTAQTTPIDNNVSVQAKQYTPNTLAAVVSASNETGPKVIEFNLAATTINVQNLKDLGIVYDGKLLSPAPNIDAILHAKPTDNPSFAIVVTQSGVQVLVLIPHFSMHTIMITNMSKVVSTVPEFPFAAFTLIVAIIIVTIFSRSIKMPNKSGY